MNLSFTRQSRRSTPDTTLNQGNELSIEIPETRSRSRYSLATFFNSPNEGSLSRTPDGGSISPKPNERPLSPKPSQSLKSRLSGIFQNSSSSDSMQCSPPRQRSHSRSKTVSESISPTHTCSQECNNELVNDGKCLAFEANVEGKTHSNEDRLISVNCLGPHLIAQKSRDNQGCESKSIEESNFLAYSAENEEEKSRFFFSTSLYAVIDGHGGNGCADFVLDNLAEMVVSTRYESNSSIPDRLQFILQSTFHEMEAKFCRMAMEQGDHSGACMVVALYSNQWLCIGNVGDCLGVLMDHKKSIKYISKLHRANVPSEKQRLLNCGVPISGDRICGSLIPSRTIGDIDLKLQCPGAVTAEPFIRVIQIEHGQKNTVPLLILATDGLWDVYNADKTFKSFRKYLKQYIKKQNEEIDPCLKLCLAASQETADDVTAVIVKF